MTLRSPQRALVALALLLAPAARADDCALRVAATPAALTLGVEGAATVRVEGTDAPPLLAASVGEVRPPRAVAPGAWEALYVPPSRGAPQVALVSAVGESACGFVAILLSGQGDALVDTTPRARITVRIGERRFGPERADDAGRAVVPVVVPPGVHAAHHGERAIALDVPPSLHVHLAVAPLARPARADRTEAVRVVAFAVNEDGTPWAGDAPALEASAGELSPPARAGAGAFAAVWRLPPGAARVEEVTATLAGDPLRARAGFERVAGPVAAIALRPARARFTAGESDPVAVVAELTDAAGNPADAEGVRLACEPGEAGEATRLARGTWRGEVRLASAFGGRAHAAIVARAGGVEGKVEVALVPGAVARLELTPAAASLAADARGELEVRARAVDAYGNAVPGAAPALEATLGTLGAPRLAGDAVAFAYRAPRLDADGSDVVRASAGAASASVAVALVAPAPRLATALRVGLAARAGGPAAAHLGAQAATYARYAGHDLGLALDVGWTASSDAGAVEAAGASAAVPVDGSTQTVALLAGPAWRRRAGRLTWWSSLGLGAAWTRGALRVEGQPSLADAAWVPAAAASVALGVPAWRGLPFVELRAGWQGDPKLARLHGALVPITLALGWRHEAF